MRHATIETLGAIKEVLAKLRKLPLNEKSPGVFYFRSRAFLHFHEDLEGLFADVRPGKAWQRIKVSAVAGQRALVACARKATKGKPRKT